MSAIHSSGTITDGSSTAVLRADNHADRFGGSLSRRAQTNRIGHVNADQETVERQPDIMDVRSRFQHRHRNRRSAVDDQFADIVPAARTSRRAGDPLVVHCDGARVKSSSKGDYRNEAADNRSGAGLPGYKWG
jgi:hypothetical protein